MPLTTIDQSMTTGLLKSSNNLSEINTKASREAAMNALSLETAMPVGIVLPYAGANPPSGWLLCNGQSLNNTQYPELLAAIGYTYGGSVGTLSFNVPDLRGRIVAGLDVQLSGVYANRLGTTHFGSNGQSLGQTGGSESNTLTSTEMPAHSHFVANTDVTTNDPVVTVTNSNTIVASNDNPHNEAYILSASATAATVGLSSTTGSGGAHANVQPTMILNYIIKAKFEGRV